MPLAIYKKPGLGTPTPVTLRLLMADMSVKKPMEILCHMLVRVGKFIFLANFITLGCQVDFEVPIIFGRSFLATGLTFNLNIKEIKFNVCIHEETQGGGRDVNCGCSGCIPF